MKHITGAGLFFVALFLVALTSPAVAALSGFYDSAEKITTILSSSLVADAVGQAPVVDCQHRHARGRSQRMASPYPGVRSQGLSDPGLARGTGQDDVQAGYSRPL